MRQHILTPKVTENEYSTLDKLPQRYIYKYDVYLKSFMHIYVRVSEKKGALLKTRYSIFTFL